MGGHDVGDALEKNEACFVIFGVPLGRSVDAGVYCCADKAFDVLHRLTQKDAKVGDQLYYRPFHRRYLCQFSC